MTHRVPYITSFVLCVLHAVLLSCSIWMVLMKPGLVSDATYIRGSKVWIAFAMAWPLWSFVFWPQRDGKTSRAVVPLVVGFVALLPALFWLFALYVLNHRSLG